MEDRDAWDSDLLAVLALVGDFQFDDGVVADVPFVHDLVMKSRDRCKKRSRARADLVDTDQGLAVPEYNAALWGEEREYRGDIHRVGHREEFARVGTRDGTH